MSRRTRDAYAFDANLRSDVADSFAEPTWPDDYQTDLDRALDCIARNLRIGNGGDYAGPWRFDSALHANVLPIRSEGVLCEIVVRAVAAVQPLPMETPQQRADRELAADQRERAASCAA